MRSNKRVLVFIVVPLLLVAGATALYVRTQSAGPVQPVDRQDGCSDGWRITGYFTPVETDYNSGQTTEIEVARVGKMSFDSEFIRTVFDDQQGFGEGWGRTRFGWYLGNFNGRWHKATDPLDANNSPLRTNSVAVDNAFIPNDSIVTIPNLPGDFGQMNFIANDVGVTVHGKHIDVYTGEGKDAEQEMYHVTREEPDNLQRVCFQTSPTAK